MSTENLNDDERTAMAIWEAGERACHMAPYGRFEWDEIRERALGELAKARELLAPERAVLTARVRELESALTRLADAAVCFHRLEDESAGTETELDDAGVELVSAVEAGRAVLAVPPVQAVAVEPPRTWADAAPGIVPTICGAASAKAAILRHAPATCATCGHPKHDGSACQAAPTAEGLPCGCERIYGDCHAPTWKAKKLCESVEVDGNHVLIVPHATSPLRVGVRCHSPAQAKLIAARLLAPLTTEEQAEAAQRETEE